MSMTNSLSFGTWARSHGGALYRRFLLPQPGRLCCANAAAFLLLTAYAESGVERTYGKPTISLCKHCLKQPSQFRFPIVRVRCWRLFPQSSGRFGGRCGVIAARGFRCRNSARSVSSSDMTAHPFRRWPIIWTSRFRRFRAWSTDWWSGDISSGGRARAIGGTCACRCGRRAERSCSRPAQRRRRFWPSSFGISPASNARQ